MGRDMALVVGRDMDMGMARAVGHMALVLPKLPTTRKYNSSTFSMDCRSHGKQVSSSLVGRSSSHQVGNTEDTLDMAVLVFWRSYLLRHRLWQIKQHWRLELSLKLVQKHGGTTAQNLKAFYFSLSGKTPRPWNL